MFVLEVAKISNNSSSASTRAASRFALQISNKQKQGRSSSIKIEENKNLAVKIPQSRVHQPSKQVKQDSKKTEPIQVREANRSQSRSPQKKESRLLGNQKPLNKRPLSQEPILKPRHCRQPSDPLLKVQEIKQEDISTDLLDLWEYCQLEATEQISSILKKYLKQKHFNLNRCSDNDGCTALHLAVREGSESIVKMLLKSGADILVPARDNQLPLHFAAIRGKSKIVKLLIQKSDGVDFKDLLGQTALHYAIINNNKAVVKLLLREGADPNLQNLEGLSAFQLCQNEQIHRALKKYSKKSEKQNVKTPKELRPRFNSIEFVQQCPEDESKEETEKVRPTVRNIQIMKAQQSPSKVKNYESDELPESDKKVPSPESRVEALSKQEAQRSSNPFFQISQQSSSYDFQEQVGPDSFDLIQMLGKGSFGKVYLVRHKRSQKLYALKILEKKQIFGQNLIRYAMTEKEVLKTSDHPFIVKLYYAFQTNNYLYLVLQFCPGGDLGHILKKERRLTEARAKFYIAQVILALQELHSKDIIFRDLKPDNVIIDNEGHARLTDFGLSKMGISFNQQTRSFCGSVAYLAPEVLNKAGHGKSVDWYLTGVLLYEMLQGTPPYYDHNRSRMFQKIKSSPLTFKRQVSDKAQNLIRLLLIRDPKKRLGAVDGVKQIKSHPFFKGVAWQQVMKKMYKPPAPEPKQYIKKLHFTLRMMDDDCPDRVSRDRTLKKWTFIRPEIQ